MACTHDVASRIFAVDARHTHLAREFRARPWGPHSPQLRALLDRMRYGPLQGKYVLIRQAPDAWALARLSGRRGVAPALAGPVYGSAEAAEWAVFAARWEEITGQPPDIGEGGGDDR